MTVKRYDIYANNPTIERQRSNEVEHLAGKWVLYADHLTAMQRERAGSERLADALKDASFAFALEVTANGNTTDGNMDRLERWNAALAAAKKE